MNKTIALALFVASFTGCAFVDRPGQNYTVYIDPAFGDRTADVVNAFDDWATKVQWHSPHFDITIYNLTCDSSCTHVITIHPETLEQISNHRGTDDLGYTHREWSYNLFDGNNDWSNIYIGSDMQGNEAQYFDETIKHEIGHSLGLVHTGCGTLMRFSPTCASPDIAAGDIEQYEQVRGY